MLQLYKILREHKNPKVLSEGLLWMVSALEDFGISHVKLKVQNTLPTVQYLLCGFFFLFIFASSFRKVL